MALIFVVDDNVSLTHIVEKALQYDGHQVQVYPDGRLALKALKAQHPDLIVLDIMMPKMDGLELAGKSAAARSWPAYPSSS